VSDSRMSLEPMTS